MCNFTNSKFTSHAFQWPIIFNLNNNWDFTSLSVIVLTHPVNFLVGGNQRTRRKPTTFGRVLTDSFHMSEALGSSNNENVLTENRTRNLLLPSFLANFCQTFRSQESRCGLVE